MDWSMAQHLYLTEASLENGDWFFTVTVSPPLLQAVLLQFLFTFFLLFNTANLKSVLLRLNLRYVTYCVFFFAMRRKWMLMISGCLDRIKNMILVLLVHWLITVLSNNGLWTANVIWDRMRQKDSLGVKNLLGFVRKAADVYHDTRGSSQ